MATICGMSVILTILPLYQATPPPSTIASTIRPTLLRPGMKKVTTVAPTIAKPAQTMPLLAVTGEAIALRPRMNTTAAMKYAMFTNQFDVIWHPLPCGRRP